MFGTIAVLAAMDGSDCTAQDDSADKKYAVIVHASIKTSASSEEVKRLYLKLSGSWTRGTAAKPFDRKADNPARRAFLARVLRMSESQLAGHWLSMKQKTGATRPLVVRSDRSLAKLVAKRKGAFGFTKLKSGQAPPKGTRVLFRY